MKPNNFFILFLNLVSVISYQAVGYPPPGVFGIKWLQFGKAFQANMHHPELISVGKSVQCIFTCFVDAVGSVVKISAYNI